MDVALGGTHFMTFEYSCPGSCTNCPLVEQFYPLSTHRVDMEAALAGTYVGHLIIAALEVALMVHL